MGDCTTSPLKAQREAGENMGIKGVPGRGEPVEKKIFRDRPEQGAPGVCGKENASPNSTSTAGGEQKLKNAATEMKQVQRGAEQGAPDDGEKKIPWVRSVPVSQFSDKPAKNPRERRAIFRQKLQALKLRAAARYAVVAHREAEQGVSVNGEGKTPPTSAIETPVEKVETPVQKPKTPVEKVETPVEEDESAPSLPSPMLQHSDDEKGIEGQAEQGALVDCDDKKEMSASEDEGAEEDRPIDAKECRSILNKGFCCDKSDEAAHDELLAKYRIAPPRHPRKKEKKGVKEQPEQGVPVDRDDENEVSASEDESADELLSGVDDFNDAAEEKKGVKEQPEQGVPVDCEDDIEDSFSEDESADRKLDGDANEGLVHPRPFVSARNGDLTGIEKCLDQGIPLDMQNENGRTMLHTAACFGKTDIVDILLSLRAKADITDKDGNTALIVAAQNNHMDIVRKLVEYLADTKIRGAKNKTAAEWAEEEKNMAILEYLVGEAPRAQADVREHQLGEMLYKCAKRGDTEAVEMYLKDGAPINWRNSSRWTPLHVSSRYGKIDTVKLLFSYCANIFLTDKDGMTAAERAKMHGFDDVAAFLADDAPRILAGTRAEQERKVREKEAREKAERERKAREEAERKAREEAERERKAREEAEQGRKAREKAERERKAREEAERKAREEARRKAVLIAPTMTISLLHAMISWLARADEFMSKHLQPEKTVLQKIRDEVKSSLGSANDGGPTAAATLAKHPERLAKAEAEVTSVLDELEKKGVTAMKAGPGDRKKLNAAIEARDNVSAEVLKSVSKVLKLIGIERKKLKALPKRASDAITKVRDALSKARLSFEQIGGNDQKDVENHSIEAGPRAPADLDLESMKQASRDLVSAIEAEIKAAIRALDPQTSCIDAAPARSQNYKEWNAAKSSLNDKILSASTLIQSQRPAVVAAARGALANFEACAKELEAIYDFVTESVRSETERMCAAQKVLVGVLVRAFMVSQSKKSADFNKKRYFDIKRQKSKLQDDLRKKQDELQFALSYANGKEAGLLKTKVDEAEKALREFAKDPKNKQVENSLALSTKTRPEIGFYFPDINPFEGHRVRQFGEYDDVVSLSVRGSKCDKLYSATIVSDDDTKGAKSVPDVAVDPLLAEVLQLKDNGNDQRQIIRELKEIHEIRDILRAIQHSNAMPSRRGDAKVPPRASKSVPCVLKAFENTRVLKDLRRAIHVMGNLSHPNVIKLQGVCRDDGKGRWLVQLPRYPRDLWQWVLTERKATMSRPEANGRTPAEAWQSRCAIMLSDMLRGLAYLHSQGVVHRDFKPQNVLVGPSVASTEGSSRNPVAAGTTGKEYPVICDFETCTVKELRSGATTTRNVMTKGYVDPRLLHGKITSASPETDMYSFGIVMAEMLLGRRLDNGNPIQSVTRTASARNNMTQDQRDIIVSLLRKPGSRNNPPRPTARELLQLPFFSTGPVPMRECILCSENKPLDQGVQCCKPACGVVNGKSSAESSPSPHFTCSGCFDKYVWREATDSRKTCIMCPWATLSQAGDGKCIKCQSPPFADNVIAAQVSKATFDAYMRAKAQAVEAGAERRAQAELKRELEKVVKMADEKRRIYSARKHILDNLLNDMCPRCHRGIVPPTFDGDDGECFALFCQHADCECSFCAWCFKDCGEDAHRHVATCEYNLEEKKELYSSMANFKLARVFRLTRAVRAYLSEMKEDIAEKVVRECANELIDVGLEDLVDEYTEPVGRLA